MVIAFRDREQRGSHVAARTQSPVNRHIRKINLIAFGPMHFGHLPDDILSRQDIWTLHSWYREKAAYEEFKRLPATTPVISVAGLRALLLVKAVSSRVVSQILCGVV